MDAFSLAVFQSQMTNEMLVKTLLQVQFTQNEMLWKALLERSAYRGPSEIEILRELRSLLPDRTNDIVTGIEIGKSLMAHRTPAAPRDDLGASLRGVLEALRQAPAQQSPQPPLPQYALPPEWAPLPQYALPPEWVPVSSTAVATPPLPTQAELRAAISDPVKWEHIRTVFAVRFSQQPQPATPEEVPIRAAVADPIAWERVRTIIEANHAPQQPAAVPQSGTIPVAAVNHALQQPAAVPRTVSAFPTEFCAVFGAPSVTEELLAGNPVAWEPIRILCAMHFSHQPQPTTPAEARIRAAVADPVAWARTIAAVNHAPQQPEPEPAAPQSVTTAGTVLPAANHTLQPAEAMATTPAQPQVEPAPAPTALSAANAEQKSRSVGAPDASTLAAKALPSSTPPAPNAPGLCGDSAVWQHIRTVCVERIRCALTKNYTPSKTATLGTPSADTAKPNAEPARSVRPPSGGEAAPTATPPQRCNPAARPPTGPQRSAPPRPRADNLPICCFLTAERREPVLFGGRRLPIGLG